MDNMKKTIGIIGGGQLGQMMAISAQYMGHRVLTLDPNPYCSAVKCSDETIVAEYDDVEALRQLAQKCDLLTYEFENVSAAALHEIADIVEIPQSIELLEITQNRQREKEFLESCGVSIAPYKIIRTESDLPEVFTKKQVLKTCTGGYDGHGQVVLKSSEDIPQARELARKTECVLEDFVNFDKEISVIVSGNGREFVTFPVCENEHINNILHRTIAPARVSEDIRQKAEYLACVIAEKLQLFGTLCVEMFLTAEGEIYVNELAPRPHNSGHYTIEACDFSQFDLHVKGILGEKLSQPQLLKNAMMLNLLGQHVKKSEALSERHPEWHLHDYGKLEAKYNRKMGHVTILTDDFEQSLKDVQETGVWDN
ncbi:MAG: 5-(carboxyamino)imidazole ribonucleotide synthase [Streptococcaceae bacterium]|jgi:5-(carboxyamino)imidazole ribonucleotide synthase|nr:5-(carboxyamino)imidazole ribonucleotide synthase [Streptococcaceae bacterium]